MTVVIAPLPPMAKNTTVFLVKKIRLGRLPVCVGGWADFCCRVVPNPLSRNGKVLKACLVISTLEIVHDRQRRGWISYPTNRQDHLSWGCWQQSFWWYLFPLLMSPQPCGHSLCLSKTVKMIKITVQLRFNLEFTSKFYFTNFASCQFMAVVEIL